MSMSMSISTLFFTLLRILYCPVELGGKSGNAVRYLTVASYVTLLYLTLLYPRLALTPLNQSIFVLFCFVLHSLTHSLTHFFLISSHSSRPRDSHFGCFFFFLLNWLHFFPFFLGARKDESAALSVCLFIWMDGWIRSRVDGQTDGRTTCLN